MTPGDDERRSHPPGLARVALAWGLFYVSVLLLITLSACEALGADGPYAPGDTLRIYATALDSLGRADLPDTATVIVSYLDNDLDTFTYPGDLTQVGNLNLLTFDYIIPSTWEHAYTLAFYGSCVVDSLNDQINLMPAQIRVNARSAWVGTVDSSGVTAALTEAFPDSIRAVGTAYLIDEEITAGVVVTSIADSALASIWAAGASESIAVIDSTSCTPCGVYTSGGAPMTGAVVYVTRDATINAATDFIHGGISVAGNYKITVPLLPGVPDTFYVHAYRQGTYNPSAAMVVIP